MPEFFGKTGEEPKINPAADLGMPEDRADFGMQRMADRPEPPDPDPEDPTKPPEKPEREEKDENDVPKELWPYRDEMLQWINQDGRYTDLVSFLQYRKNAKFKLIAGMGFYHAPTKDIISLDVTEFKKMREERGMTSAQIMFGAMHEFAHLKTMGELDLAGKYNELEQFNYEKKKGYFVRNEQGEKVRMSAASMYRQYYNICEDAIVNSLVFGTGIYGRTLTENSRRNNQEVVDLYTNQFFPVYLEVGENNGDFVYMPQMEQLGQNPLINVDEGKGNIRVAEKEDYGQGFDWDKTVPKMNRSSQFVTYFMKNQMTGLSTNEVFDESKNPEGKHKLNEDVGVIYTRPLSEAYKMLLERFVQKYKDDPDKLSLYLDFMSDQIKVPFYDLKGGKKNYVRDEVYVNVAEVGKNGPVYSDYQRIDINFATQLFERKIRDSLKQLGLPFDFSKISNVKYMDIFNLFKQVDRSRTVFGTKPLKYNLVTRTRAIRNILEPLYSLLCVLDDSFKSELPPEPQKGDGKGGGEGGEPPEIEEAPDWQPGDKVKNKDRQSPNFGKKGIITKVLRNEEGITSVEVEYLDEKNKMADGSKLAGITETITSPINDKLKVIKKKSNEKQRKSDFTDDRDTEYEEDGEEKEKEPGDEETEDKDGDDQDDGESEDKGQPKKQDNQPASEPGQPGSAGAEQEPQNIDEVVSDYEKALREMIEQDERDETIKEVESEKRSPEYQKKKTQNDKFKRLLDQLKDNQPASQEQESRPLPPQEMVDKFLELEEKLRVPANKMAEAWLQIIKNISRKIDTIVDKYYRQGKPDIKRLQKLLPEIEFGADIDRRLIHSLIVEKIKAELKPKMLRVLLLVDNSGSMSGNLDAVRMSVMLLNSSLRNFRKNFQQVVGGAVTENIDEMDVVCDTEIWLFGDRVSLIKPFSVTDFSFLTDKTKSGARPTLLQMAETETVSTIRAFQRMNAKDGDTRDALAWSRIALAHDQNPKLKELLNSGYLSEIIFQISDGASISHQEIDHNTGITANTFDAMKYLRENYAIGTGAMGIGAGAVEGLRSRYGENVIPANNPDEIAEKFSAFLTQIIESQIEKPMMETLEKIENNL